MSHEGRAYRRYGLHVVRISGYRKDGFTLLISGRDEPDRFLSSEGRIPLARNRRALVKMLTHLSDDSGLDSRVEGLLREAPPLQSRRWMSFRRIEHALARPPAAWLWEERALILGRLEFLWDLCETLPMVEQKERLKRGHPLGELAELSYAEFENNASYVRELTNLDLRRGLNDALEIMHVADKYLTSFKIP